LKKKRFEVETYFEAVECECGGTFQERAGDSIYMSFPPQADYRCSKCRKCLCLSEEDWPGIRNKIIASGTPTFGISEDGPFIINK